MGCPAVLIKGGHGQGSESIDYLFSDSDTIALSGAAHRHQKHPWHRMLAVLGDCRRPCQGRDLETAVRHAKAWISAAIAAADRLGSATATARSIIFTGFIDLAHHFSAADHGRMRATIGPIVCP